MIELCSNTTKIIDHMLVCLDSAGSSMAPAVVAKEVTQPRNDVKVILEKRNTLSNKMDLWFFRVAKRMPPLEQKKNISPGYASALTR